MATGTLGSSYADFVEPLAALNVAGVGSTYTEPPQQVNAADLPIQYVQLPRGTEGALTVKKAGGWPQMTCGLVVLIKPYMQDANPPNYAASVAMIDAVSEALRGANYLGKTSPSWTIRVDTVAVGSSVYWAVVADVRTNG